MLKLLTSQQEFSRRAVVLGGVGVLTFSALASRLLILQWLRADEYSTLSSNNSMKLQLLAPERGRILDRLGVVLAENKKNFRLLFDAGSLPRAEAEAKVAMAAELLKLSPKRAKQIMVDLKPTMFAPPVVIKENLSWEEVAAVELHQLELGGMRVDSGQVRHYPFAEHASHLVGYVGLVAPEERSSEPLMRLPGFRVGKQGAEKFLEDKVQGTAGVRQVEVNVRGQIVREVAARPSVAGKEVRLTIDSRLQEFIAARLGSESGAVAVMDTTNGDVLALVSMPGYDPNQFSRGITAEEWKTLNHDKKHPLINKVVAGQYPPGSTIKPLMGLAALEARVAKPGRRVHCPGHFFLGDHRFNCWKPEGHGDMDLHEAIAQSCDTYFYTMAQQMGIEVIAAMSRRFGLGALHDIGFSYEKPGLIADPAWKEARYKQRWTPGDTVNVGIGQGYILTTPLQMCVLTARLASGFQVKPRLVTEPGTPMFEPMAVDAEHLRMVQAAMDAVVNSPTGTAYGKRLSDPNFAMAGKTGTSQVRKIVVRGQDQSKVPWEGRHHAWFIGYAPVGNPRYAVAVLIEHGGGGSSAAAPIARDVLLKIQELEG